MSAIDRNPTRFVTYLLYVILFIIIAIAIYFFIVQQFLEVEPEIPSEITFVSPAPDPISYPVEKIQLREAFEEDFKSWELAPAAQAVYDRGALVLNDNRYDGFGWAQPNLTFDDFILEVYARWLGGALGGAYGLDFRLDEESGDHFSIYLHNDGRYTVGKRLDGDWFVVVDEFSPAIQRNGGLNLIRIEAIGETMRFFVNNTYLVDIANDAITKGDIRLVVKKVEGTDEFLAAFDDLVIARYP